MEALRINFYFFLISENFNFLEQQKPGFRVTEIPFLYTKIFDFCMPKTGF
jgi:hypothetical protein